MESVHIWFDNGSDYWSGVELYSSMPGAKPTLLRNFRKKLSPENLAKLRYELEPFRKQVAAAPVPLPVKIQPLAPVQPVAKQKLEKPPVYFQNLPKELRPVLLQANAYFREACLLKADLNDVPAGNVHEALQLQLKIHSLKKRNALCWEQIDHWERHGKIPAVAKPISKTLSGGQQAKRQAYLFSSISKLRKRLQANADKLATTNDLKERTRLEKAIAKQSANLLQQETQLNEITALIDNEQ